MLESGKTAAELVLRRLSERRSQKIQIHSGGKAGEAGQAQLSEPRAGSDPRETAQRREGGGEQQHASRDQAFELHREPDADSAWLQMIETRHTPWLDLGSKRQSGLCLHKHGLYFNERPTAEFVSAAQTGQAAGRQ